jgi:cysteine desulfurase/selenocysteine lyase
MLVSKNEKIVAIRNEIPLSHCGVSPLSVPGFEAQLRILTLQRDEGVKMFAASDVSNCQTRFRKAGARLFHTAPENISYIDNVAHGLNLFVLGFPWQKGDSILVYDREYPSNVHPWQRPGADFPLKVKFVQGTTLEGDRAHKLPIEAFEKAIDSSTRAIAVSHVQFMSGYTIDIEQLGALCKHRGLLLIVDAAQSAGCLPITPEKWGADVVVSSGWKWLLGPLGSGIMYTSPRIRAEMSPGLFGPDQRREERYEDLGFTALADGRKFEPSSLPKAQVAGLAGSIEAIVDSGEAEDVWHEIKRLQGLLLEKLDGRHLKQVPLEESERSGILSFVSSVDPALIVSALKAEGVILPAPRGDYLRLAPHFFLTDDKVVEAAEKINCVINTLASHSVR